MKTGLAKRLPLLVVCTVMMATTGTAIADTTNKPYLKTFGADVMTGGWFSDGQNCSNYQNPRFSNSTFTADDRAGGILTYVKSASSPAGGSSSQYGALSLGEIDGRRSVDPDGIRPPDGFYSEGAQSSAGGSVKSLTFANTNISLPFGGKFEGNTDQGHCIPDYFDRINPADTDNVQPLPSPMNWQPIFNGAGGDGIYYGTAPAGGSLDLFEFPGGGPGDKVLRPGKRIVIAIKGNVYIKRNIVYDPGSSVDSVPKFTLLVKGSIYVDPSVTKLDGLYIAQPADNTEASVASDTGVFWSCHPKDPFSATNPLSIYYIPNCQNSLVVRGAVIAKQANLIRVKGDVGSSGIAEDNLGTVSSCAGAGCNVAEVINYTPAMVMGGSFFETSSGGTPGPLKIDSLVSLPPVF